jgi:hypothetical protein
MIRPVPEHVPKPSRRCAILPSGGEGGSARQPTEATTNEVTAR